VTCKVIYLQNLQDIWNVIGENKHTILRGFLGMAYAKSPEHKVQLIHSIHNTGRKNVKVVLVPKEHYDLAIEQFGAIHQCLLSVIEPIYHKNAFVDGAEVSMTGGQQDTIHSCNSSNHASELLVHYNPQDGAADLGSLNHKRFRPIVITYAAVTSGSTADTASSKETCSPSHTQLSIQTSTQRSTSVSSLTDSDFENLYERMKRHVVSVDSTSQGISAEEMENIVNKSNDNISQVWQEMRDSVTQLASKVETINISVAKQNTVVAGLQLTMESTVTDLKNSVNSQVNTLALQIKELRELVLATLPPSVLQTMTMPGGQGGT